MTFSFIQNPTGQAMTDSDLVTSALDQPMSLGSTFWDQTKGGVLESFGLGTAIRSLSVPEAVPPESDSSIVNTLSAVNRAIAPETIVRRIAGTVYDGSQSITEDQYKQSPSFRKDIPWQQGMTEERAAALAEQDDVKQVRAFYGQKRPVTAFFGNLAGQAVDPINYIPIAGEAVQAANVARFGRVTGKALTSALDAAANTAIAGLSTASERGQLGDDVSWQSTVSQIAMAAMIGGAFGAIHGRFGRSTPAELRAEAEAKLATLDNVQASRVSLNDALDGMIRDSEVNLSPASSEFVAKAADQELPKVQGYRPEYELQRVEDGQAAISADQIDRVSRTVPDPGQAPKRPQTLFDFLASSGGIKEDAGELKSLGVSRKFVPGRGALVRKSGMALDKAREAAAQAGYFDHLYGSADEATAKSTVRDLLDLVDQEARGTPAYSMAESDRVQSLSDHAAAVERRDDYKKFVKDLSDTLNENKIGVSVDDAILARATDIMVEEKLSPLDAFDKAVLEDEARLEASLSERGISYSNDPDYADIPFFDEPGPTSIEAGGIAGEAQRGGGPGGFEGNASDRRQPAGALGSSLQSVDRSVPADPVDPAVAQAATRVGKPEATRALAEQYRVNPETGDFPELADIEQLRTEGRLTEDDLAALDDADEVIKTANAYGEALKSFASCVI
jgi:hypothetical protein